MPQELIQSDGTVVQVIHFIYLPRGTRRHVIACAPFMARYAACDERPYPWQRSDDARVVNCPACMGTDEYKVSLAEQRAPGRKIR